MPEALPIEKLKDFIKTVPPFHLLPRNRMDELVRTLMIEYFPKGETILSPKGPPTRFLYIIRSGGVRFLQSEKEGDRIYDYRDEGDFFGLISLLSGEPSPFTIVAEEDTLCYLIKKDVFKKLLGEFPDVFLYFTSGPSKGFRQFDSALVRAEPGTEQVLFACRIREVMHTNVLTCSPEETVVGIARRMTERGVGSVIVVDDIGVPMGILTDGDLRSKVLASGKPINLPVMDVMNRPVQCISPDAFCFEAILSMTTNRIKYLPIMDGTELVGIISEHDLMVSQGNNPVAVIKGIQQATTIEQVVLIRKNIDLAMNVILEHGGMAKDICELITTLNDHLTRKIIVLAEEAMVREGNGRPPIPYAWLALGSEGRREQTLRTDQDNALIFADDSPKREEEVRTYFLSLAEKVVSGLEQCGFPRCKGRVMAINPKWCQPFHVWKEYFRHWILDVDYPPEEVLATFVFFDCRAIYGQYELVTRIAGHILELLDEGKSFVREMAKTALLHKTPLGFFKRLVVEKSGEHKNKLNLKLNGLTPLVDAIRTLALSQKVFATNTLDRISALVEKESLPPSEADDLRDAFNVLMLIRVRHHVNVLRQGRVPDNYVNPDELSIIQRTMLKEAFKSIDRLQGLLELHYEIRD
ncbi:MAG TPA: putative nucleotidyltransferase substrate binding domain-containing protein [Thermodesulfobacteriota bacterium]|nr:putative nucleotidyltransferase substrate binding domain-containing protein [Thermodesulfobacteriota bacterium]